MSFFPDAPAVQVPSKLPTFIAVDFETGGVDVRVNPPLSMAVVITDEDFNELDGFAAKILPPKGTVLGVPSEADQRNLGYETKAAYFLDVFTGEYLTREERDSQNRPSIEPKAAIINGFITTNPDGAWNLNSFQSWLRSSRSADAVAITFRRMIAQYQAPHLYEAAGTPRGHLDMPLVQAVAHNASFDRRFCTAYFPGVADLLVPKWVCTAMWYKRAMNIKKGYKLSDVCEKMGRVQSAAHEALSDCRDCLAAFQWLKQNHPQSLSVDG